MKETAMLRKGRPVSVNKCRLKMKRNKAEVLFVGDIHIGHPTACVDQAQDNLNYCLKKKIYVLGMGDFMECGTTQAIGDSVYTQKLNPQEQMEEVIKLFTPVARAGLLLGMLEGNHENRIFKATGINVMKTICGFLSVPYLFMARWNLFKVGTQTYKVYAMHGKTGSKFAHTKLKAAADAARSFNCDVMAYAHVHDIVSNVVEEQSLVHGKITHTRKLILVTGHYMGYDLSYAQAAGMQIGKIGSPKVVFYGNKHSVHVSM